jgi:hypothetical protein
VIIGRGRRLVAAAASGIAGVGFGLPCDFGIWYTIRTGEVWEFLGFSTYGNSREEREAYIGDLAPYYATCSGRP